MPEAWDELAGGMGLAYRGESQRVPALVIGGIWLAGRGQGAGQEPPGVLGEPQGAGAAAEQAGRERPLHRVLRAQVGEPGRGRGWREAGGGERARPPPG